MRTCRGERVVDALECSLVELPERRLDADGATDGVSERLAADDSGAQLVRGGERVVDLVMARKVRAGRVGRPVAGDAQPFDVGPAKPKRLSGEKKMRARLRDERVRERLRGGAGEKRGDGDDQLQDVTILGVR